MPVRKPPQFDIRAMAEVDRLGENSFVIFKVPADFAVWAIAFVKWCLGIPPSIRSAGDTQMNQ
jgi:hypothetical protein